MTTTERPEKRLVRCEHPSTEMCECRRAALDEVFARWAADNPEPPQQSGRELIVLSEIRPAVIRVPYRQPRQAQDPQPPLVIADDDERHGDSLLGAAGAWACVAVCVLLMLALTIRGLWLWLFYQ